MLCLWIYLPFLSGSHKPSLSMSDCIVRQNLETTKPNFVMSCESVILSLDGGKSCEETFSG